jgi:hypothetical protein
MSANWKSRKLTGLCKQKQAMRGKRRIGKEDQTNQREKLISNSMYCEWSKEGEKPMEVW